jgi:hypothetical protein
MRLYFTQHKQLYLNFNCIDVLIKIKQCHFCSETFETLRCKLITHDVWV